MGATVFVTTAKGSDPNAAFASAVDSAAWEFGHGGYTGTIAEKRSYCVIEKAPLELAEAQQLANRLVAVDDERVADKWGPAGAIAVGNNGKVDSWLFFGWASE